MRKWMLTLLLFALAPPLVFTAPAWAGPCAENAYGLSTLRGDAQYPPGWNVGPIKISPPDEFVFAIIDGAAQPQQFVHLKAKLQNRLVDYPMGAGTVTAVARYRKRTDYQPDLSTDPPGEDSVEEDFSSSISAPVTVSEIPLDTPVALTFDFSAEPIPAGITDLFLLVLFTGQIGEITNPITVVSFKDLNEPMHFTPGNSKDLFLFEYQVKYTQSVLDDPDMMAYIEEEYWTFYIYMYHCYRHANSIENCYIGFTAESTDTPIYVASYQDLEPGRHGRIIAILGEDGFYIHERRERIGDCQYGETGYFPADSVINQIDASGFSNTAPISWRGIKAHQFHALLYAYPEVENFMLYRDMISAMPPPSLDPVPAASISFP